MKKWLMLGIGMAIGMMLSDCKCCESIKKPMKQALKKINIE